MRTVIESCRTRTSLLFVLRRLIRSKKMTTMVGNKNISDWNPTLYEQFKAERMQPFVELLSLVPRRENMKILDLGCGQGENTKYLLDYFPMCSKVLGIDNSESMLQKAKTLVTPENASRLRFEKRSIEEISTIGETWDVIIANASLHWVQDHHTLLKQIVQKLTPNVGRLAVQSPTNHTQEFYVLMKDVASLPQFDQELNGWRLRWPVEEIDVYATILYHLGCKDIVCFEKVFPHVLNDAKAVTDWVSATGMRTYLSRLSTPLLQEQFIQEYENKVRQRYPTGPIFFPFRRLFFAATRGSK